MAKRMNAAQLATEACDRQCLPHLLCAVASRQGLS
jgi:hypothetical protein